MTTAIALETSKGDLPLALALGLVLLAVVLRAQRADRAAARRAPRSARAMAGDRGMTAGRCSSCRCGDGALRRRAGAARRRPADRARRSHRAGRRQRLRQDALLLRAAARPGAAPRRAPRASTRGARIAMVFQRPFMLRLSVWRTCELALLAGQACRAPQRRERALQRAAARRPGRRCATGRRACCRAASRSGSRWRAPGRCSPTCCFSTSRPRASTRRPRARSRR